MTTALVSIAAAALLALPAVSHAAVAGRIQFVSGDVRLLTLDGRSRPAQKTDPVNEGDTVLTGQNSFAQIKMIDEGLIALRPDSHLRIDRYRYAGREDGSEEGLLGLIKGGFRTLTGVIGRTNKSRYLVRTPNATIGIRGTDHEPLFIAPPAPGETPPGTPGTYNKVNVGETFIESKDGRIELGPNQVGFASLLPGIAPAILDRIPPFMRATPLQQGRDDRRQMREQSEGDARHLVDGALPPVAQPQGPEKPPFPVFLQQLAAIGLTPAPFGFAGVGGDKSGPFVGSGAAVVAPGGALILLNALGTPEFIVTGSGFQYARLGAPLVAIGGGGFIDSGQPVIVRWGIYAGGAIVDPMGPRPADFFHFMGAEFITPPAVQAMLSGSYNNIVTHTKFVTETGALGGILNFASITISTGNLTGYSIGLTDAQARGWGGGFTGSVSLGTFAKNGVPLSGNVSLPPPAPPPGPFPVQGSAHGLVVGPTGKGIISSFDLKTTRGPALGVTGSFAVKQ